MALLRKLAGITWFFVACAVCAESTDSVITACDLLAGHPSDPDKLGPGAPSEVVSQDLDTAIAVCRRDLDNDPDNARLMYNLGRVTFYNGELADGLEFVLQSAERGHAGH